MRRFNLPIELRVSLLYAIFGSLWILLTDRALDLVVSEPQILTTVQTIKGWIFVVLSALLIFLFLRVESAQRRAARRAQSESEERFGQLFENSMDAILLTAPDGSIIAANPAACRMFERSEDEIKQIGRNGVVDTSDPNLQHALEQRARTGSYYGELTFLRKDGTKFPGEISTSLFVNREGLVRTSMIIRDISQRRQTEQALRESQDYLRAMIDCSPVALYSIDLQGRVVTWNPSAEQILGWSYDEVAGRPLPSIPADKKEEFERLRKQALEGGGFRNLIVQRQRKDGSRLHASLSVALLKDAENNTIGFLSALQDITELVQAERQLRQYADTVEWAHIIIRDMDNRIISWTKGVEQLYGWSKDEAIGKVIDELLQTRFPQSREEVQQALMTNGQWEGELQHTRRDGSVMTVFSHQTVHRDLQGNPLSILEVNTDITARKRAEAEVHRLNAELERRVRERTAQLAEVNRELESFTYSVSHDLRAPLRAINGFSQIIARRYAAVLDDTAQQYLQNVIQASEMMGQLIDDLLQYSLMGKSEVKLAPVALQEVITSLAGEISEKLASIGAQLSLPAEFPSVLGDRTLLWRCFANLLENAITYRKAQHPLQIVIDWRLEGQMVVIRVSDNGIGIPAEHHEKIFQIFQRLHRQEDYPGTGIGLAMVKKSVELMNGDVWVESQPGQGSTFYLRLPAA
jgi:PAS domain S-box-containing protein